MNWDEIRRTANLAGWLGVAYDFHYRVLNRVTRYMVLQGKAVTMETVDPQYLAGPDRYRYGFLDEAALRRLALDPSNRLREEFLDQALSKGDACYAVMAGETLVSFGWYSNKPTRLNEDLEIHFDPAWVYAYHAHTRDEYRGQRLNCVRIARAAEAFTQRGLRGAISYIEANNFGSLKSLYRVGSRDIGKVYVLGLPGRHVIRRDAACREYGFDVKVAARERSGLVPIDGSGAAGKPPDARRRWLDPDEARVERGEDRHSRRAQGR